MAQRPGAGGSYLTNRAALLGGQAELQVRVDPGGQDFDGDVQRLHDKVKKLKRLAGDLDEETKYRTTLINDLEASFLRAQASMRETLRRMNKKYNEGGGGNHMIVLVLFALCMFLGMYLLVRGYKLMRLFV